MFCKKSFVSMIAVLSLGACVPKNAAQDVAADEYGYSEGADIAQADSATQRSSNKYDFTARQSFATPKLYNAIEGQLSGLRNLRPVLAGVLYRGGGPGGMRPMSSSAVEGLCEAGFGDGIYLYGAGFSKASPANCQFNGQAHSTTYQSIVSNQANYFERILTIIHASIKDEAKGPVFVHCWNGSHASGLVAAIALRQFCDWSSRDAQEYWKTKLNNPLPASNTASIMSKIASFDPIESLKITSDEQKKICPGL